MLSFHPTHLMSPSMVVRLLRQEPPKRGKGNRKDFFRYLDIWKKEIIKKRSEKKSRRIEKVRRIKIYTGLWSKQSRKAKLPFY